MKRLRLARLQEIMESFKDLSVMIVGDFALDVYWYADMTRSELSRETPHFMRPIIKETYSPGASGNICCNVTALGVKEVYAVAVVGDDWRGQILSNELRKSGVRLDRLIDSRERVTSTYIKPILCGWDSQQEDARIDFVNNDPMSKTTEQQLIENIKSVASNMDTIIIEDQMVSNGVITKKVREAIIGLAKKYPDKVFVSDSRERIGLFSHMVLKPNRIEAVRAVCPSRDPKEVNLEELKEIGIKLQKRARRPVYVTLSERGALVVTDTIQCQIPATPTTPPIDTVGAGDTFMAVLGTSLSAGADPIEAGIMANLAAGVVVKKLNITGTATPNEMLRKYEEVSGQEGWP